VEKKFYKKSKMAAEMKKIVWAFHYPNFYDIYFFLGIQKIMLVGHEPSNIIFQKSWFSPTIQSLVTCQTITFFGIFLVFGVYWADSVQKFCILYFHEWVEKHDFDRLWSNKSLNFWNLLEYIYARWKERCSATQSFFNNSIVIRF
jgi:hypothetical protein